MNQFVISINGGTLDGKLIQIKEFIKRFSDLFVTVGTTLKLH